MVQIKKGIIAVSLLVITALVFTGCGDSSKTDTTVDLTDMSATVRYAYLNDILYYRPEDFLDKTIIAEGQYVVSGANNCVFVQDSCCAQSINIVYSGTFPPVGTFIRVKGIYSEFDSGYYYIDIEELKVI